MKFTSPFQNISCNVTQIKAQICYIILILDCLRSIHTIAEQKENVNLKFRSGTLTQNQLLAQRKPMELFTQANLNYPTEDTINWAWFQLKQSESILINIKTMDIAIRSCGPITWLMTRLDQYRMLSPDQHRIFNLWLWIALYISILLFWINTLLEVCISWKYHNILLP